MLTYIPNTYSLPAHKAVKEWMTLVALVLLLSSNIYEVPVHTFFASKFTKSNEVASLIAFSCYCMEGSNWLVLKQRVVFSYTVSRQLF